MFGFIANIYTIVLYKPLFNALVLLYNYIPGHDFGIAIIILTLIIKIVLHPLSVKAVKSQKALQKIQPLMQEIQQKYKDDKEKQAKEMLNLYKTEKVNPFSGILLALIQLPILIALYQVFWKGLNQAELGNLYSFVVNPVQIKFLFLGFIDLSKANIYLAVAAGVVQFLQTKMLLPQTAKKDKKSDFSVAMQAQMTYMLPIFTVIILLSLPSALGLYWTSSGVFTIIQQYFILKKQ